jgi:hypothetical protein
MVPVRSRPELLASASATLTNTSRGQPVVRHHVGRVGGVVAAQDLVDAMRMLQCRVAGRRPLFHPLGLFGKAFRRIDVMLGQ